MYCASGDFAEAAPSTPCNPNPLKLQRNFMINVLTA